MRFFGGTIKICIFLPLFSFPRNICRIGCKTKFPIDFCVKLLCNIFPYFAWSHGQTVGSQHSKSCMSSTRSSPKCLLVKFPDDVDIARSLKFVLIANKMAASRLASLTEDDFEDILRHKDAENKRKATQKAVTLFRS